MRIKSKCWSLSLAFHNIQIVDVSMNFGILCKDLCDKRKELDVLLIFMENSMVTFAILIPMKYFIKMYRQFC